MSVDDARIELDEEFDNLVRLKIIEVDGNSISIKFLDAQYEECLAIGNKRSEAAKARWSKAKGKQKESKSMQLHTDEVQDYADKNRKEENRKEENRKEESNKNSPTESSDNVDALDDPPTDTHKDVCKNNKRPTIDLVIDYFVKNGYSKKAAVAAFEYYEAGTEPGQIYWRDSKGNEVRSWKQKMRGVWFKEENKVDKAIPIVEPGWKYVGLSEAYDIVRDQNNVSLSEQVKIGAGDDFVRKMMNMNPSYKNAGKGWKYRKTT